MKTPLRLSACLALAALAGCGKERAAQPRFATLKTSKGAVTIRLYADKTPKTVENFAALAEGRKPWRDPRDGKTKTAPLYDGVLFHRVIPGFMVQTGDPRGDGKGDVGFTIPDELHPELRYDRPGLVGMANHGPDTGASQFFITLEAADDLNGRHTLFGEVVEGLEVVRAIAAVPRDPRFESNRPLEPVVLEKVTIRASAP